MRRNKRNQTHRRESKGRLHVHESEGQRMPCRECKGTGQVDTAEYKGRCLRCDGIGEVVMM